MPGTVITITSGKGGVGKTTTVANIAAALSLAGQRVVAIDGDIGLRNLDLVMGLENQVMYDVVDVVEKRCKLQDALVKDTRLDSLWLLPAAQTREKADVTIDQLTTICQSLRHNVDFIIIDSPAGIEHGFQSAVAPADRVLVVTTSDVSALRDADKVLYLLESQRRYPPGLILNRYNPRLVSKGEMRGIDDVLDILAIDLLGVVPEDSNLVLSSDRGIPIVLDPNATTAQAYHNIAQRILGNNVPLMEFEEPGFWTKVRRFFGRR
ncbi:MAG: septum site-determining protein MinD [Caldilineaceae bacterium]